MFLKFPAEIFKNLNHPAHIYKWVVWIVKDFKLFETSASLLNAFQSPETSRQVQIPVIPEEDVKICASVRLEQKLSYGKHCILLIAINRSHMQRISHT
jgi:hypothetical protein